MLVCYYQIFQLTFSTAESSDQKSSQLAAIFNDPEMAFRCSRLKRRSIHLLGPVHKVGNITFECDYRRNICGSSAAERRDSFLSGCSFSEIGDTHRNYLTPFPDSTSPALCVRERSGRCDKRCAFRCAQSLNTSPSAWRRQHPRWLFPVGHDLIKLLQHGFN
jgi:hypothetical protein